MIKRELTKDKRSRSNPTLPLREELGTQDAGSDQAQNLRVTGRCELRPSQVNGQEFPYTRSVLDLAEGSLLASPRILFL